jgi:hypothetical protein
MHKIQQEDGFVKHVSHVARQELQKFCLHFKHVIAQDSHCVLLQYKFAQMFAEHPTMLNSGSWHKQTHIGTNAATIQDRSKDNGVTCNRISTVCCSSFMLKKKEINKQKTNKQQTMSRRKESYRKNGLVAKPWKELAPMTKSEREATTADCFLDQKNRKYPVCMKHTRKPSCRGLKAASSRARLERNPSISKKAKSLIKKYHCDEPDSEWLQRERRLQRRSLSRTARKSRSKKS